MNGNCNGYPAHPQNWMDGYHYTMDEDGNFYVTNWWSNQHNDSIHNAGIGKYDSNGNKIWSHCIVPHPNHHSVVFHDVQVTSDGRSFWIGFERFGPNRSNSAPRLIVLDTSGSYTNTLNTELNTGGPREFFVYPNPNSGRFKIEGINWGEMESVKNVTAIDLLGRKSYIAHHQIKNRLHVEFPENARNGLYILQVEVDKSILNFKVNLQR